MPDDPEDIGTEQAQPTATDELVDRWFVEAIHNSVVSQNTEVLNHLRKAVDDLKRRLNS
jgi:hypothetical protein